MQCEDEITAGHWLRETQKGYIRIAVLILLSKKPYHGYEIMREIKERTMGFWRPTAGGLFTEFMKDVLDVEKTVSIPRIPNLFSVFLEERKEKPEDTMNVLEGKRKQIEKMIKELQKELAAINRRVAQLERFEQNGRKRI
jgi:hypothetical protein